MLRSSADRQIYDRELWIDGTLTLNAFADNAMFILGAKSNNLQQNRRIFRVDSKVVCEGAHPFAALLSWQVLNRIRPKLAYNPLTPSSFNRLDQYTSSPGNRAYCYAELAVSSLAAAETIDSIHFAYPQRDGQAMGGCERSPILLLTRFDVV